MSEEHLFNLKLTKGQIVLVYLSSGNTICGPYLANYDSNKLEFEIKDYWSGDVEKIKLTEVKDLITSNY